MQSSKTTLFPKENVDPNYSSGNILIRWLIMRLLRRIADVLSGINAADQFGLDMGCGGGNVIQYLHHRQAIGDLVAVDLDVDRVRFAKDHFPYATYFSADINQLIFREHTFDYIIATEIFEHLPAPHVAIEELRRIAKRGAYLLVSVPYEPFFHWGNLARGKYWGRMGRTPTHVNYWNRTQFRQFLGQHVSVEKEFSAATFPWLLYLCVFSAPAPNRGTQR
ncbi:MAG: class I SAM-dependent methyltransferase, partial [Desulfobacterales bacterium]